MNQSNQSIYSHMIHEHISEIANDCSICNSLTVNDVDDTLLPFAEQLLHHLEANHCTVCNPPEKTKERKAK